MRSLAVAAAAALVLAGCGGDGSSGPARTLTVSAAASLTDVFTELEQRFEADNPGVDVVMNAGASSDLAQQIVNGAPADVFASANIPQMDNVTEADLAEGEPEIFVTNQLTIVLPPGNPQGVESFADLADPDVALVVCAEQVPCGAATKEIQEGSGVTLMPVSEEPDVRSVLSQVTTGNADAGVVFVTDAISAGERIERIDFPESDTVISEYPIVALTGAQEPELAAMFVELVRSDEGRQVLEAGGFGTP